MRWLTGQVSRLNVRYWLSKVVPVRMQSTYTVTSGVRPWREHAVWWQWRGRVIKMVSCERLEVL